MALAVSVCGCAASILAADHADDADSALAAMAVGRSCRKKVFEFHLTGKKVPYTCTQCSEAWCLQACPVDAIRVDSATGAKVVLEDTCVGCKVCTISCPFGTINYVQDTGKVQKCDLCGGDPACASACPTGAIAYVDADWTGLDKMRDWADKLSNQSGVNK